MRTACLRGLLVGVLLAAGCSEPAATDEGGAADLGRADGHQPGRDGQMADGAGVLLDGALHSACLPGPALVGRVSDERLRATLEHLTGMLERSTQTGQAAAVDYLAGELEKLAGLAVRRQSYSYRGESYDNLEVTIRGAALPGEFVLAGAHYDAVADVPGADDDASGTAAVLEAARALAGCQPRRSIRLLFFSNEEAGIVGSTQYVASIKSTMPPDTVVGVINLDMVGYGTDGQELVLAARPADTALAQGVETAVERWSSLTAKPLIDEHCG